MPAVTVNLVGVTSPGLPRQLVLPVDEDATIRSLLEELSRQGGEAVRRAIWAADGDLEGSLVIAVNGEVVDAQRLDTRLPLTPAGAEVSVFLIRPLFGGSGSA